MRFSGPGASAAFAFTILTALGCALVSCGGGSGSRTSGPGRSMATKISAVPADFGIRAAAARSLADVLAPLAAPAPEAGFGDPGTDYSKATAVPFVMEPALNQFDFLTNLCEVINQTGYQDHVGAGPYVVTVMWPPDLQGRRGEKVWTVQAEQIPGIPAANGKPGTEVRIWEHGPYGTAAKMKLSIFLDPAQEADKSFRDFGAWTLNVQDGFNNPFYAASASLATLTAGDGSTSIDASVGFNRSIGGRVMLAGVAHRNVTSGTGYGQTLYPDWSGEKLVPVTTSYVYDPGLLLLHRLDTGGTVYKDRTGPVPVVTRYGLYDAATGADVLNAHAFFGFPASFELDGGHYDAYYYDGGGHYRLESDLDGPIPAGTVVQGKGIGAEGAAYKAFPVPGTLARLQTEPGNLDDITGIISKVEENVTEDLVWDGTAWLLDGAPFTDFALLQADGFRRVRIKGPGAVGRLVYDPNASPAGFFRQTASGFGARYTPAANDSIGIRVTGYSFIGYKGADQGWVRRRVSSVDPATASPVFDPDGDTPFTLELNQDYEFLYGDMNVTVRRTQAGPDVYSVTREVRTVINPGNAADLLGGAVEFHDAWFNPFESSTYAFDTHVESPNFFALTYKTVGSLEGGLIPTLKVGDIEAWGGVMAGYDAQNNLVGRFEWVLPDDEQPAQGYQTLLYTGDGPARKFLLLEDPIPLAPLSLTSNGLSRTLNLNYDGNLYGMPRWRYELGLYSGQMTDALAGQIFNIPAGTPVADGLDSSKSYVFKPLELELYLKETAAPATPLDSTRADAIKLDTVVPPVVENGMGDDPL